MRVFNLTENPVDYRGKVIPPYGSMEYSNLSNLTDKDLRLVGILSYGSLPPGWTIPSNSPSEIPPVPQKTFVEFMMSHPTPAPAPPEETIPEAKHEDVREVSEKKDYSKEYGRKYRK